MNNEPTHTPALDVIAGIFLALMAVAFLVVLFTLDAPL